MRPHRFLARAAAPAALLVAGACTAGATQAQTVYRCPNGSSYSYSQQACANGQAVEVGDARTPAQQREAADAAHREAALAEQLAQERHAREAAPGAKAIAIGSVPKPARAASSPAHKKKPSTRHRKHHVTGPADDEENGLSAPVRVPSTPAR